MQLASRLDCDDRPIARAVDARNHARFAVSYETEQSVPYSVSSPSVHASHDFVERYRVALARRQNIES